MNFESWKAKGAFYEVGRHRIFVIEEGENKPYLCILHGYPSCSYDYHRVLPALAAHFHVVVHDQPGFGLSGKPEDYSYSLIEQADAALLLWKELGIEEAYLLGHDYGTSVATEIIARRNYGWEPVRIKAALLGNGSILIGMANLRLIQLLLRNRYLGPLVARLSNRTIFNRNMKRLWADPGLVDSEELEVLWQMLNHHNGRRVLPNITRYLFEREKFWHRWVGGLYRTSLPIKILWAEEDPVAVVEMAYELHEHIAGSELKLLPDIGHYPMLEAPEKWANAVIEMLKE
ncbi:MAG: alpha/beta hydrolase [Saprospiraceae bacterium]|nr:alpha/beta hydrolase [Saprospiraceae bacterium]